MATVEAVRPRVVKLADGVPAALSQQASTSSWPRWLSKEAASAPVSAATDPSAPCNRWPAVVIAVRDCSSRAIIYVLNRRCTHRRLSAPPIYIQHVLPGAVFKNVCCWPHIEIRLFKNSAASSSTSANSLQQRSNAFAFSPGLIGFTIR